MSYTIIEAHIVYENDAIKELFVLWKDGSAVRATKATNKPSNGYKWILPNESLDDTLMQSVAAYGSYLTDDEKPKYFPGKEHKFSR